MQIVIDIPDVIYEHATRGFLETLDFRDIRIAIMKGTPLPKGHWIEHENCYECSNCGIIRAKGKTGLYNYCPNCGAEMEVGHDS